MDMDITILRLLLSSCMWSFIGVTANRHCKLRFKPDRGYCIKLDTCTGATLSSLCPKADTNLGCCLVERTPVYSDIVTNFTFDIFTRIFNKTLRSRYLYKPFIHSLKDSGIHTCHQQAAFSALVAFDTKYLKNMEDIPKEINTSKNRTQALEYWKYTGRGLFHIPGKLYYQWINKTLRQNVVDHPELLAFPSLAFDAASAIWKYSYTNIPHLIPPKFNNLVDGSRYNFQLLRYYISGQLSGMDNLLDVWDKINKILKCDCSSSEERTCTVNRQHGKCRTINDCKGSNLSSSLSCPGPPSVVRCCFACSLSTKVYLVMDNTIRQSIWLSTIVTKFSQKTALSTKQMKIINFGKIAKEFVNKERFANMPMILQSNISSSITYIEQDLRTSSDGAPRRIAVVVVTTNTTMINTFPWQLHTNAVIVKFVTFIPTTNKMLSINYFTDKRKYLYGISDQVDQLMECVCSGPWETKSRQKLSFTLQHGEKVYLGLNTSTKSNNLGIKVHNIVGETFVDGIPSLRHLPGHQNGRCLHQEINAESDLTLPLVKSKLLKIFIKKKTHQVRSILIDDKIQIAIRGLKHFNTFELSIVDITAINKEIHSNQGTLTSVILLGCITAMVCCFLTFVTLIISMCISKKRKHSDASSITQIKMASELQEDTQCNTQKSANRKISESSCSSATGLLIQTRQNMELRKYPSSNRVAMFCLGCSNCMKNVKKPFDLIHNRSVNIECDFHICKVVFVFLFNTLFLIGMKITRTKIIHKVVCTLLTYFSSAVYSWSLVEVVVTICIGKGYKLTNRLFLYLIALVPPLFWSIIPCSLIAETSNCYWISWNDTNGWIALSFMFLIFLSLTSISIYLCIYERIQKGREVTIDFKRSNLCLLSVFSMLFGFSVLLLVSSITWPSIEIFQFLFVGSNTTLGIYVLFTIGLARKEIKIQFIAVLLYLVQILCPNKNKKGDRKNSLAERMRDRFCKDENHLEEERKTEDYDNENIVKPYARDTRLNTLVEESDLQISGSPTFINKSL